jgi:tryptophan synthase beta chain
MHTLGHTFIPPGIHAGGLRYHGMSPQVSALVDGGYAEARSVRQLDTFKAGLTFLRAEGSSPRRSRPTPSRWSSTKRSSARPAARRRSSPSTSAATATLTWGPTTAYLKGELEDYDYPAEAVEEALHHLPRVSQ